ncbi:hypothetical protein BJX99DRAFT_260926 [Aspergillus californicus]
MDQWCFVLTIHHAAYDAWSIPLLLKQVERAYQGKPLPQQPFAPYLHLLKAKDEEQLRVWNGQIPKTVASCIHEVIWSKCQGQPAALAVASWDGDLTYGELDHLSSKFAAHLANDRRVNLGDCVPLLFEKSKWIVVAMLAVLKTGVAFVLLDPSHPIQRLQSIFATVKACLLLCSSKQTACAVEVAEKVVVLDDQIQFRDVHDKLFRSGEPFGPAYAVFTSGTTATPKGVVITHASYLTSAKSHIKAFRLGLTSRILQFASFSFDASILEILSTLLARGSLCIPSEEEKLNNIAGCIRQFGVKWLHLTPTVARLLRPEDVTSVTSLVLVGEKMSEADVATWAPKVKLISGKRNCDKLRYLTSSWTPETWSQYRLAAATVNTTMEQPVHTELEM